jgi:hypothetical protein
VNHEATPREAARAYVARGWAVVPMHVALAGRCSCGRRSCAAPGKHPRVRWQQFESNPPSGARVDAWWRRWPDANVGVLTGPVSGLAVLDIDPRNGGDASIDLLEAHYGPHASTVESATGGGGRHLWFRANGPAASAVIAPGCELKGAGGIVVAPPSVHPSGRRYCWRVGHAPGEIDLADAPAWLWAAGAPPPGRERRPSPPRTASERAEFAQLWNRAGVVLRPGDRNYLCPFHDDHHPSLHVDAEGCRWLCFGCRRGGGVGALRRELGAPAHTRLRHLVHTTAAADQELVTLPADIEVDVIGESAHQDTLLALTGGRRSYAGADVFTVAELAAGPREVEVRIDGMPVGHLTREDADTYRALFGYVEREDGTLTCEARIVGGWDRGRDDVGAFGVRVLLPRLDDVPPGDARDR